MPRKLLDDPRVRERIETTYFNMSPRPNLQRLRLTLAEGGLIISVSTLRRFMNGNFMSRERSFTLYLTPKACAARKTFADILADNPLLFSQMIFSDEKLFVYNHDAGAGTKVWIRSPTDHSHRVPKFRPVKLMVFGFLTVTGKGAIYEVPDGSCGSTISGDFYASLIKQYVAPYIKQEVPQGVWQQDNASVHKTQAVWNELKEIEHLSPGAWPPYSPDFSPIEGVWAVMKSKVDSKTYQAGCLTKQQLSEFIFEAWKEVVADPNALIKMWERSFKAIQFAAANDGRKD